MTGQLSLTVDEIGFQAFRRLTADCSNALSLT